MKNLDQLIAEELENTINSEDRRTATTLERFAKALLAELVVEKEEERNFDQAYEAASMNDKRDENFIDGVHCGEARGWNAAVDAFNEKKKNLLS